MLTCRMKTTTSMVEDSFGYSLNGLSLLYLPAFVRSFYSVHWRLLCFAMKMQKKGFSSFSQLTMEYLLDCFASLSCIRSLMLALVCIHLNLKFIRWKVKKLIKILDWRFIIFFWTLPSSLNALHETVICVVSCLRCIEFYVKRFPNTFEVHFHVHFMEHEDV